MARQDKSKPGRVTPKGTTTTPSEQAQTVGPGRTPVNIDPPSSPIVPIVMFGSLAAGILIIIVNYLTEDILGTPSNWYLFGGLALILAGIVTATQYK